MADIAIFRINYKSDFILTLNSDAGWLTPFCIKFWTGSPLQAYYAGYDGTDYTHCAPVEGEPTKLLVQFDDHHLSIGDLKFQIGYHFTVADFPTSVEDEVLNQASVIIEVDDAPAQVMLDLNGETAPEIQFTLPAYTNEQQRIANEEQRIAHEAIRIVNEESRIAAETIRQQNEAQRISNEESRVTEFDRLKSESEAATIDANAAATLANAKAALAADKAALADAAATLANEKAQLAADKAALADAAATLANDKAALAQQKAEYAQTQGDYAKSQGDYAKEQGEIAEDDHERAEADHTRADSDHTTAGSDHTQAGQDHTRAESDHTRAESDHTQATSDHTQAGQDHTRAESDHTTAAADHTQAGQDHTTAASDHTQAGQDHTRAESDHTRAESDHASVEVYVDSLGAFDISAYHATGGVLAKYADLTTALGTNGANIPEGIRKGGMSVKFVQSSDSKYVQYRYMSSSIVVADFTNVANWQGVDEEPIADSKNLITSGAAYELQEQVEDNTEEIDKKANKDGYYETLGAGTASNLRGQNVVEQQISYRPSGGNLDVATGAAFIDSIKGKTVKFNQKVVNGDFSNGTNGWLNTYNTSLSVNNTGVILINANLNESGSNVCCPQNFTPIVSHKYYLKIVAMWNFNRSTVGGSAFGISSSPFINQIKDLRIYPDVSRAVRMTHFSGVGTVSDEESAYLTFRNDEAFLAYYKTALRSFVCIDMTEMFGAGNEPTTAAEFEQWCEDNLGDSEYFDYDDGSLLSVKMNSLKTTGFNLYNPNSPVIRRIKNQQYQITGTYTDVWESWNTEVNFNSYNYGNTVNYCEYFLVNGKRYLSTGVVPNYSVLKAPAGAFCIYNNQVYKCTTEITTAEEWNADHWTLVPDFAAMVTEGIFTMVSITPDANGIFTPTERYIHVEGGNATDTCVHLVHSGERNGEYEPYKENTKSLPITTMQGRLNGTGELVTIFPDGLKSAGTVYDEIKVENGVVKAIKRVGSVDMGTLDWGINGYGTENLYFQTNISGFNTSSTNIALTAKYNYVGRKYAQEFAINAPDMSIAYATDVSNIKLKNKSYTELAPFKTAISGEILYYELDTPQEYVVDGFDMPAQYLVDDWGIEMTIPQNDGEAVTALATLGIRYGVNAVDQLRRIPKTTITSESMDNFLIALGAQMGGTWTKTWNSETNKYDFTFTATPEPEDEEEVEPQNN